MANKDNPGKCDLDNLNPDYCSKNEESNKNENKLNSKDKNIGSTSLTDGFLNNSIGVNRMNHERKADIDH